MEGVEQKYCDTCINAVIGAWRGLMEVSGQEVLCTVPYGKGDTLGLDAIPEININGRLGAFDSRAFLITEELDEQARRRWPTDSDPERQPLMFFCDPTDRSSQLKKFFERISRDSMTEKIGNLMEGCDAIKLWEEMFEPPRNNYWFNFGNYLCAKRRDCFFGDSKLYHCNNLCSDK